MNHPAENTINFNQAPKPRYRPVNLIPRSRNQENLVRALTDAEQHIVIASGPAGTGKTYLAMLAAIKSLRENSCQRIVLTRPAVEVAGEKHGFLPGNLVAKMEPWTRPLLDVLNEYYRTAEIAAMIQDGIIEIAPLAFMRGRTFRQAWIIADEMQNATPSQVKMLMTRIGEGSRIVITGDLEQADRTDRDNGLMDVCERLSRCPVPGITACRFGVRDIQRHHIIDSILEIYSD
jgi:phosphate starvation-inducible PhoH-like protein